MLEVVAALQDPTVQLHQLERLIGRDAGLSFPLLRYINSAFLGLRSEISSIGQALALLGVQNLRRGATLTVPASSWPARVFTLGLFSVIDALISRRSEKGALLEAVTGLEAGDFDRAQRLVRGAGDRYLEALIRANEAAGRLFEPDMAAAA
jgi:EAL and modified HD-GYP domain-containing signal transduction protein